MKEDPQEDPCETCLFKTRCKEFCERGIKYHKKQIFLSLGEASLRRFRLEALLLVHPIKSDEFLREYPNLEKELDNVQGGNELVEKMNLLDQERDGSGKTKKRSKSKKTRKLNLFVGKNKRKKNLFKSFLSIAKELINKEETE